MKHYSRENERSQAKITELERRRNTCEAGLAALEACWTQVKSKCRGLYVLLLTGFFKLISTIRSLAKPDDLEPVDVSTKGTYCSGLTFSVTLSHSFARHIRLDESYLGRSRSTLCRRATQQDACHRKAGQDVCTSGREARVVIVAG